jgi:hypothetical protein
MSKSKEITYNPFGILTINCRFAYKHKFPSGMCNKYKQHDIVNNFDVFNN